MSISRFSTLGLFAIVLATGLPDTCAYAQTDAERAHILNLIHTGRDAMQRGDLPAAEQQFQLAVTAAPTLSDGYLGLGLVQVRRGELDAAVKSLSRTIELNPNLPGAHLFLGISQYQIGQPDLAVASLRSEIALQPSNIEALTWLGIVELGQDHPELATAPLDQALALTTKDPRVLYYSARAHMLVAEADYRQLGQLDPDSALVHRGLAESYSLSAQPEKALTEYELAVQKDPSNPDLYEALAEADQKMGKVDASKVAYEKALQLNPHSAIALYNVGRLDVERGKPADGIPKLRQAEGLHASPAPTDFYLGLGLAELGENAEAAQWLEKSLTYQPSAFIQQGAWYQLARVYQKLDRKADSQHALDQLKLLLADLERQKQTTAKQAAAQSTPLAPNKP